jgi:hypothetical protein
VPGAVRVRWRFRHTGRGQVQRRRDGEAGRILSIRLGLYALSSRLAFVRGGRMPILELRRREAGRVHIREIESEWIRVQILPMRMTFSVAKKSPGVRQSETFSIRLGSYDVVGRGIPDDRCNVIPIHFVSRGRFHNSMSRSTLDLEKSVPTRLFRLRNAFFCAEVLD